jgi:hypothetical protein
MCDLNLIRFHFHENFMLHEIINLHFNVTNTFTLLNHHPIAVTCSTTFTMTNTLMNATEKDQEMTNLLFKIS